MRLLLMIGTLIVFNSCDNQIPKEKLTIIDNFVLGQSSVNLSKQMDSLSISHKKFFTKQVLSKFDDLIDDNNSINMYYTNTFNLSNFRSNHNEHIGLLYPITLTGTKNVMGMIVVLGHTSTPWFLGDTKRHENTVDNKLFKQEVNRNLIDEIKKLYTSKYGQPITNYKSKDNNIYVIEGNQIEFYPGGDPEREGEEFNWQTEYYDIRLFTGVPSYESVYQANEKTYQNTIHLAGPKYVMNPDLSKNEVQSFSYCYIKYELNSKAIKELKLDNKNL